MDSIVDDLLRQIDEAQGSGRFWQTCSPSGLSHERPSGELIRLARLGAAGEHVDSFKVAGYRISPCDEELRLASDRAWKLEKAGGTFFAASKIEAIAGAIGRDLEDKGMPGVSISKAWLKALKAAGLEFDVRDFNLE